MIANELWQQFGQISYQDIPESTTRVAKQCLLDWMACVIAGSDEPLAKILRDEFGGQTGSCSIIGSGQKTSAHAAALINGATGHALDFDDTHTTMGGHATVPVAPAVWAVAEEIDATGEQLLTAFVAGLEIECRLGMLVGPSHYARGWHVTSSIGVFGAAAAVSHLLGLSDEQFSHAFGLAASQAGGLKANFGTMTKPFHAGHAAQCGLDAARLAQRGFTSNPASFEGNQGLVEAASSGSLRDGVDVQGTWLTNNTLFKYNAACYLTHATIEGLKVLGDDARASNCDSIDLFVHPSLLNVCGIENPTTGLEAKFSLRANAAMTVLGFDTTDPATYSDANVQDDQVQSLLGRVTVNTDGELAGTQSRVVFHGSDDSTAEQFFDTGIPASDLSAQQAKLEAKFDHLVSARLGEDAARLKQHMLNLDAARAVSLQ